MNTTNILLGTVSLLLVIGFALSFGNFTKDRSSDDSKDERSEVELQIAKLEAENRALELQKARGLASPAYTPALPAIPPVPSTATTDSELTETLKKQLEEQKRKVEDLENENSALASEKEKITKENEEIFEDQMKEKAEQQMAAKRIKMALAMGTVTSASKEYASVIFTPTQNANFQPGKILAVRRNTGIIGKIQVDRLDDSGDYVATMRQHGYSPDGYPDIQPGDTVIIDPNG